MVRQAHHPEPSRRVNLKYQFPMTKISHLMYYNSMKAFASCDSNISYQSRQILSLEFLNLVIEICLEFGA